MAIDSRNKRGSVLAIGLGILLPLADGTVDRADRQQLSHYYSGIDTTFTPVPKYVEGKRVLLLRYRGQYYTGDTA